MSHLPAHCRLIHLLLRFNRTRNKRTVFDVGQGHNTLVVLGTLCTESVSVAWAVNRGTTASIKPQNRQPFNCLQFLSSYTLAVCNFCPLPSLDINVDWPHASAKRLYLSGRAPCERVSREKCQDGRMEPRSWGLVSSLYLLCVSLVGPLG